MTAITNPAGGGFFGDLGSSILGGLEGLGGFASDVLDVLSPTLSLSGQVAQTINQFQGPGRAPSPNRAPTNPAMLPALPNQFAPTVDAPYQGIFDTTDNPADDLFAQVGGGPMPIQISPTRRCSTRLPSTVEVPYTTPSGMKRTAYYKNMGRPILFTGDRAAAKRYAKHAGYSLRRRGGR